MHKIIVLLPKICNVTLWIRAKKLIIVIILLIIIIGGVSFYAFHQAKENKEIERTLCCRKLEMENEYTTFATQYDELQVQINNDSHARKTGK